jgi:hypothetical protein
MIHYKKFLFTEFQGKLPRSEKPSRNSCHESNTSYPNLPSHFINMNFYITCKSAWGSIVSTVTRIYYGQYGVQILAGVKDLSFFQNIQTSSSTPPASNSMTTRALSLAVKWPGQTVWPLTSVLGQVYISLQLYLHSTCLLLWHILGL